MMRLIPTFLLCTAFYFVYIQALECGIVEQMQEENLKSVLKKCVVKKTDSESKSENKTSTESSEETDNLKNLRKSTGRRVTRDLFGINSQDGEIILKRDVSVVNNFSDSSHNDDEPVSEKCVLQCIFSGLGMVDSNGYPEHQRVAQGLLKNAKTRELRDFIQDSTDECFQLVEQGEKSDSCEYAINLVTCLAEKGRSNCADWQIINIPFHT